MRSCCQPFLDCILFGDTRSKWAQSACRANGRRYASQLIQCAYWGAWAACSEAAAILRHFVPPETPPHCACSLHACRHRLRDIQPPKIGGCPRARAPLPLRLAYFGHSRDTLCAPHTLQLMPLCLPDPRPETPPITGRANGAQLMRLRARAPGLATGVTSSVAP